MVHDLKFEMILIRIQQRGFKVTQEYRSYLYEQIKERPIVLERLIKYYGV